MRPSDRYLKIVEWSEEDACYVGSLPGICGPCCHGADEARVYRELGVILGDWIEIAERDGEALPPPTAGWVTRRGDVFAAIATAMASELAPRARRKEHAPPRASAQAAKPSKRKAAAG